MSNQNSKDLYKQKIDSPVIAEVAKLRDIAKSKAIDGGFDVDSVVWFSTITKK